MAGGNTRSDNMSEPMRLIDEFRGLSHDITEVIDDCHGELRRVSQIKADPVRIADALITQLKIKDSDLFRKTKTLATKLEKMLSELQFVVAGLIDQTCDHDWGRWKRPIFQKRTSTSQYRYCKKCKYRQMLKDE
jgi:hypothetical protein